MTQPSGMVSGQTQLETYFTGPDLTFHFPYPALAWLPWLPRRGFEVVLWMLGAAGISLALGFWYRVAAVLALVCWGYLFVVESTRTYWQSYHYLELLLGFLLVWMPAHRRFSLDAWRRSPPRSTVPFWTLVLLRGQLVVAYFYAGVAKLNLDWLVDAAPIRWVVHDPGVTEPYRRWLSPAAFQAFEAAIHGEPFIRFISLAGAGFDLAIGFLLLARRTRILGFAALLFFHATNHLLLYDDIDWFPWLGMTTASVFLDPDWPSRWGRWWRQPRIRPPDWGWLVGGTLAVPGLGLLLGWKLAPSPPPVATAGRGVSAGVAAAVLGWLGLQALLPLRHHLIPGDARFTYEGLSFSWRLKADDHRARAAELWLEDPTIVPGTSPGTAGIRWEAWPGERVLYREVPSGRIDPARLPRLMVTLEPLLGERVLWLPPAGDIRPGNRDETSEDIGRLWQARFGRRPARVEPTVPLGSLLLEIADGLAAAGNREEARRLAALAAEWTPRGRAPGPSPSDARRRIRTREFLEDLSLRNPDGAIAGLLRRSQAFALTGAQPLPGYLIEDPRLFRDSGSWRPRLDRAAWRAGPESADPREIHPPTDAPGPLLIHLGEIGPDQRAMLPPVFLADRLADPDRPAEIRWNLLRDLTSSKLVHVSNQAFFLRRYAQRVAAFWEARTGRAAAVHARTALSLNGRPFQELVDPAADLATVPVRWFGHDPWIRDLQTPRIPEESLRRPRLD